MNILIICESKNSLFLIRMLLAKEHNISLISKDREFGGMLADTYEIPVVIGDASCVDVLEEAGIGNSDLVLTLDESDAENLVVCELAKKEYHVKTTASLVNNPYNVSFFEQNGIDHCINEAEMMASVVNNESLSDSIRKFLPSDDLTVIVKEAVLDTKSKVLNKKICEIPFQPHCLVTCILRDGKAIIPHGNTECREGDRMIVIASENIMDDTLSLIAGV